MLPISIIIFIISIIIPFSTKNSFSAGIALSGCLDQCGNLTIPFPFGIEAGCHRPGFQIKCSSTGSSPPRAFITTATGDIEISSISLSSETLTISSSIAHDCSNSHSRLMIDVTQLPYALSNTRNKFIVLGCATMAAIDIYGPLPSSTSAASTSSIYYTTGCISVCSNFTRAINGTCSGIGCCQMAIPRGTKSAEIIFMSASNNDIFNKYYTADCSYAFIIDQDQYDFTISDLINFQNRKQVPVVLDWAVGNYNENCAKASAAGILWCGNNTFCKSSTNAAGYHCKCQDGFRGNPYLPDGCQDIDECKEDNPCSEFGICENKYGSYSCSCLRGYLGDGKKAGRGCNKLPTKFPFVQVIVGSGAGLLFLFLSSFILYAILRKRRMLRLKEKYFRQNGGLLLQQQLAAHGKSGGSGALAETGGSARIFTAAELRRAADNYSAGRILGHGGNGTVYKGILPDTGRIVAIKKSHVFEAAQNLQFVNEVVLLSRVIHKNVVRMHGCCLETEVPLLVYEYIPNGTLHHHLHERKGSLSWEARLRIAVETAGALAYLHSSIAQPIIHRDIKATNILLDHNYMAKVSDFGASRLIPLDGAQITTLVQGTLGYLDPEYFHTGQLTDKSDVYSFGVVLAELLTGLKPLSRERPIAENNLAIFFLLRMKEGKLLEILEPRVRNEAGPSQAEAVAGLAKRCLRLKGEERPTMREATAEIERVVKLLEFGRHADEDFVTARLMGEDFADHSTTKFYTAGAKAAEVYLGETPFVALATGDESLDQHIMLALQMQPWR